MGCGTSKSQPETQDAVEEVQVFEEETPTEGKVPTPVIRLDFHRL